jgi:hypothetical protein
MVSRTRSFGFTDRSRLRLSGMTPPPSPSKFDELIGS